MKLDKLILVNWASLQPGEYEMSNMTLLTGPTGSGKSTIQDALQTVMTAVYAGIYNYNPAQVEANQNARDGKTKRTLWSYVVGAEDNLFARPHGAHGYVCAVFQPSEGEEGHPFTAVIAAAATVGGKGDHRVAQEERLNLLIVENAICELSDFCSYDADGNMSVTPVDKVESRLKSKYARVTYLHTKKEYLCQLYGRFRGKDSGVPFPEAEACARSWVKAIAQKKIGGVDDLVREEILENDSQQLASRITQISDLMRNITSLRRDGERIKTNLDFLNRISSSCSDALQAHEESCTYSYMESVRAVSEDERKEASVRASIEDLKEQIKDASARVEAIMVDRGNKDASRARIYGTLSGIPVANQKKTIEDSIDRAEKEVRELISQLMESIRSADTLYRVGKSTLARNFSSRLPALQSAIQEVAPHLSVCSNMSMEVNLDLLHKLSQELDIEKISQITGNLKEAELRFGALYGSLADMSGGVIKALHSSSAAIENDISLSRKRIDDLSRRKSVMMAGGSDYPNHIDFALGRMKAELPLANVRVLCDLIEPAGDKWQPAIEGLIGGSRFNFIVDAEWEAKAIDFVRAKNLRCKVIQGSLCLKHAREELVPSDSIIHELTTEHPIAKAYLIDQYGGVVKVKDSHTLRNTPRGVTIDGKVSGSRTMFAIETDLPLYFGVAAKKRAYEMAIKAHTDEVALYDLLSAQKNELDSAMQEISRIQKPNFANMSQLTLSANAIVNGRDDLSRLDLSEITELNNELESLTAEIAALDAASNDLHKREGKLGSDLEKATGELVTTLRGRSVKLDELAASKSKLMNLSVVNGAVSFHALDEIAQTNLKNSKWTWQELQGKKTASANKFVEDAAQVTMTIAEYNLNSKHKDERLNLNLHGTTQSDHFSQYAKLVAFHKEVIVQLDRQKDLGLAKNVDELRLAETSFRDVFTKQFCYEIRNNVDRGVRPLKDLNQELDRLKFGSDKFTIDWSHWVPEYKEYYDFFSAAYEISEAMDGGGDLFAKGQLSDQNAKVRDKLITLLLDDDQEKASKQLQRIADYRNYRRYEIWKDSDSGSRVALSQWGTGSGGQLETPAYIIRAAVVSNRFKLFEKGTHMRVIMHDEAFGLMDERRAYDVMKFIREKLGLQIILAMPTKGAGALRPAFTKEWNFTPMTAQGNGEVGFITDTDERDLKPDALRELWDKRREQVRLQAQIQFGSKESVA